jgi:hypothetical protein
VTALLLAQGLDGQRARPFWLALVPTGRTRPRPPQPNSDGSLPLEHGWAHLPPEGGPAIAPHPGVAMLDPTGGDVS